MPTRKFIGIDKNPTTSDSSGVWPLEEYYAAAIGNRWSGLGVDVDYLVVAGGGAGGGCVGAVNAIVEVGGAGGAGGLLSGTEVFARGTSFTLSVGGGGASSNGSAGAKGTNSVFGGFIAEGGGLGARHSGTAGSGGSGGTSTGTGGAGTSGQGFDGGNGAGGASGGGGGAGEVGFTPVSSGTQGYVSATGGDGTYVSWLTDALGSTLGIGESSSGNRYFAGGGAGGTNGRSDLGAPTSQGGLGGGGNCPARSPNANVNGSAGSANMGGGGGGSASQTTAGARGGAGGSGIVVLRVLTTNVPTFSAGLTTASTVDGNYTIYKITAGAGTVTW